MSQPINLEEILPVYKVEQDCILSKQGDITLAYEVTLPEIFTLSTQDYEALHHSLIKAIKVLPKNTVFHKQDWYMDHQYCADFSKENMPFLSIASERFFHERPYLEHRCYIMLTRKANDRKASSSLHSNLLRKSFLPPEAVQHEIWDDLLDSAGQFERILHDSGYIKLKRLLNDDLSGKESVPGLLEKYCFLLKDGDQPIIRDIHIQHGLKIGDQYCQLFTLADVEDLPSLCGARIN